MPAATYAELAVTFAEGEAARKVREQGWNTGPRVRAYQRADGLHIDPDTGYAWCASFVCFCHEKVGRPLLELNESASVGFLLQGARDHEWLVTTPRRGDCVCFYWGSDSWPDHMGFVRGPAIPRPTVEGNTSADFGGNQGEGDGVYLKTRDPRTTRMSFFRVPGSPEPEAGYWQWLAWYQGEGAWKKHGPQSPAHRPDVKKTIDDEWWQRREKFLAQRARA